MISVSSVSMPAVLSSPAVCAQLSEQEYFHRLRLVEKKAFCLLAGQRGCGAADTGRIECLIETIHWLQQPRAFEMSASLSMKKVATDFPFSSLREEVCFLLAASPSQIGSYSEEFLLDCTRNIENWRLIDDLWHQWLFAKAGKYEYREAFRAISHIRDVGLQRAAFMYFLDHYGNGLGTLIARKTTLNLQEDRDRRDQVLAYLEENNFSLAQEVISTITDQEEQKILLLRMGLQVLSQGKADEVFAVLDRLNGECPGWAFFLAWRCMEKEHLKGGCIEGMQEFVRQIFSKYIHPVHVFAPLALLQMFPVKKVAEIAIRETAFHPRSDKDIWVGSIVRILVDSGQIEQAFQFMTALPWKAMDESWAQLGLLLGQKGPEYAGQAIKAMSHISTESLQCVAHTRLIQSLILEAKIKEALVYIKAIPMLSFTKQVCLQADEILKDQRFSVPLLHRVLGRWNDLAQNEHPSVQDISMYQLNCHIQRNYQKDVLLSHERNSLWVCQLIRTGGVLSTEFKRVPRTKEGLEARIQEIWNKYKCDVIDIGSRHSVLRHLARESMRERMPCVTGQLLAEIPDFSEQDQEMFKQALAGLSFQEQNKVVSTALSPLQQSVSLQGEIHPEFLTDAWVEMLRVLVQKEQWDMIFRSIATMPQKVQRQSLQWIFRFVEEYSPASLQKAVDVLIPSLSLASKEECDFVLSAISSAEYLGQLRIAMMYSAYAHRLYDFLEMWISSYPELDPPKEIAENVAVALASNPKNAKRAFVFASSLRNLTLRHETKMAVYRVWCDIGLENQIERLALHNKEETILNIIGRESLPVDEMKRLIQSNSAAAEFLLLQVSLKLLFRGRPDDACRSLFLDPEYAKRSLPIRSLLWSLVCNQHIPHALMLLDRCEEEGLRTKLALRALEAKDLSLQDRIAIIEKIPFPDRLFAFASLYKQHSEVALQIASCLQRSDVSQETLEKLQVMWQDEPRKMVEVAKILSLSGFYPAVGYFLHRIADPEWKQEVLSSILSIEDPLQLFFFVETLLRYEEVEEAACIAGHITDPAIKDRAISACIQKHQERKCINPALALTCQIADEGLAQEHLRALLPHITIDSQEILTRACDIFLQKGWTNLLQELVQSISQDPQWDLFIETLSRSCIEKDQIALAWNLGSCRVEKKQPHLFIQEAKKSLRFREEKALEILLFLAEQGKIDDVVSIKKEGILEKLADQLLSLDRCDLIYQIALQLARQKELKVAEKLVGKIPTVEIREQAQIYIAGIYVENGQVLEALSLVDVLEQGLQRLCQQIHPESIKILARFLAQERRFLDTKTALLHIDVQEENWRICREVIYTAMQSSSYESALDIICLIKSSSCRIEEIRKISRRLDESTHETIFASLLDRGLVEEALQMIQEGPRKESLLARVLPVLAAKELDRGIFQQILQQSTRSELLERALLLLAQSYATQAACLDTSIESRRQAEQCLHDAYYIAQCLAPTAKDSVYLEILKGWVFLDDLERAQQILSEASPIKWAQWVKSMEDSDLKAKIKSFVVNLLNKKAARVFS